MDPCTDTVARRMAAQAEREDADTFVDRAGYLAIAAAAGFAAGVILCVAVLA